MKQVWSGVAIAGLAAGMAEAGGVERSTQSVDILFEEGNYAQLGIGTFSPSVSGTSSFYGFTTPSGSMLSSYNTVSLGYKQALNDNLDLAIVFDQPIGADVDYPTGTGYPVQGTTASLDSNAITVLLRYKLPSNVSLIGGLRAMQTSGEVSIAFNPPYPAPYTLDTSTETDMGYVLGIAWEKPEIAARIALTYNSAITHDFDASETSHLPTYATAQQSSFTTEIPQSVNLEFQTGIAKDTLLFGSVRWVDWTSFVIDPIGYRAVYPTFPLVDYEDDSITYNLGLGRKFTEEWSGAVLLGYEPSNGNITGNLGPKDGYTSAGLAVSYDTGRIKVTGGVTYVDIGAADTRGIDGRFVGNHGWGAGLRVGYRF